MSLALPRTSLSRIDKLLLDMSATMPEDARLRRLAHGVRIVVGDDVASTPGLQLTLLTAVNLGVKCFGRATVHANAGVWSAPALTRVTLAATLGEAVIALGGAPEITMDCEERHLILGNAPAKGMSLRVTFDGWSAAVGPEAELPRMAERAYCPPACIAAAALGIGELFAAFAGITLSAGRQVVRLSLWSSSETGATGEPVAEVPAAISVFGLGHLGQAYLWSVAALPYREPGEACIWLCDDDEVEDPNIETGALLQRVDVEQLKTRVVAQWLEDRGFKTRLLERRVDAAFRRTEKEPVIALSGFDDNQPRRWLAEAGFEVILDSGLGGEAHNFDAIAYRRWPNPRSADVLWPLEDEKERLAREQRRQRLISASQGYRDLADDECGRLGLAGKAVAVPFVGALASSIVVAEVLKCVNGVESHSQLKVRACLLGTVAPDGRVDDAPAAVRGLRTQAAAAS